MAEDIMCTNGSINHASGSPVTGGVFVITPLQESVKDTTSGFWVYRGPLAFTFSGGSATGFVPNGLTASGSIPPTAIKTTSEGLAVMREGDSASILFSGKTLPDPPGTIWGLYANVEVDDAGQVKASAN